MIYSREIKAKKEGRWEGFWWGVITTTILWTAFAVLFGV